MKKLKIFLLPLLGFVFMLGFILSNLPEKKKKKEEKQIFDCCGMY